MYAYTSSMTVAQCVSYCDSLGFFLAGLAEGYNSTKRSILLNWIDYRDFDLFLRAFCGCGQSLKYEKETDTSCTFACNGNPSDFNEYCGGLYKVSVYATGNYY